MPIMNGVYASFRRQMNWDLAGHCGPTRWPRAEAYLDQATWFRVEPVRAISSIPILPNGESTTHDRRDRIDASSVRGHRCISGSESKPRSGQHASVPELCRWLLRHGDETSGRKTRSSGRQCLLPAHFVLAGVAPDAQRCSAFRYELDSHVQLHQFCCRPGC